jgi:hypothetical protein
MPSETFQTAKKTANQILVSDIYHRPENLVLRTSAGFKNPTCPLKSLSPAACWLSGKQVIPTLKKQDNRAEACNSTANAAR